MTRGVFGVNQQKSMYGGDSETRRYILVGVGAMLADGIGPVASLEGHVNDEKYGQRSWSTSLHY